MMPVSCRRIILVMLAVLAGCASRPGDAPRKTGGPYFEGDGGKGIRIAVLEPRSRGLSPAEAWLPAMVQGSLAGDFNRYSAMTVVDRQNLDRILAEQEKSLSPYYSEDDFISLGNLTNARCILTGSITRTAPALFLLELAVSDTETGERLASWPPEPCTLDELRSMGTLKKAAEALLDQMGVALTPAGREALLSVNTSEAAAEAALSRGLAAQKNGAVTEALSYYYDALFFDDSLSEAGARLSSLSSDVSRGNIGSIRDELERRNAWLNLMEECEAFFTSHLPYELVYEGELAKGRVNYETALADISFVLASYPSSGFQVLRKIYDGLSGTGKKAEWGFAQWPLSSTVFVDESGAPSLAKTMDIRAELVNASGSVLAFKDIYLVNPVNRNISSRPAGATVVFEAVPIDELSGEVWVRIASVNGIDTGAIAESGYIKIREGRIDRGQWQLRQDILRNRQ
ncbi:MAG: CsgG/HfaB family protein [Spirochaetaceae bacterium]|jgi:tetratricopeptide (TPR) repeat protein|nr:CsgG/HfaB family protein [Spirochaetaceae bacterium]